MGMTKLVGETRTMRANPPSHVDTERVIEAKGLTFGYSRVAVLEYVSFSVNKGDFVSIIGPSGCGKSTLLLLVAVLLKLNEGTITSCGRPVYRPPGARALVFQRFPLPPRTTAPPNALAGH